MTANIESSLKTSYRDLREYLFTDQVRISRIKHNQKINGGYKNA